MDGQGLKWILFVCRAQEQSKFELLMRRPGDVLEHDCVEKTSPITVSRDYTLENGSDRFHKIVNVENYFNENVDISAGEVYAQDPNSISIT
ncbi:MAG: hypothetical protein ACYCPW_04075 [Nitrososphaerales archaeon]